MSVFRYRGQNCGDHIASLTPEAKAKNEEYLNRKGKKGKGKGAGKAENNNAELADYGEEWEQV